MVYCETTPGSGQSRTSTQDFRISSRRANHAATLHLSSLPTGEKLRQFLILRMSFAYKHTTNDILSSYFQNGRLRQFDQWSQTCVPLISSETRFSLPGRD